MDEFFRRLTSINYELFGILLPGAIAVLAVTFSFGIVLYVAGFDFSWKNDAIIILNAYSYYSLICFLLLSFIIGICLSSISRNGISNVLPFWKLNFIKSNKIRFFMLLRENEKLATHRKSFDTLWRDQAVKLATKLDLKIAADICWPDFYFLAKTFLYMQGKATLVDNFQNKYTFHRSISIIFVIIFWSNLAAFIYVFFAHAIFPVLAWWIAVNSLGSYYVANVFYESYCRYWVLFGDVVISEVGVAIGDLND